MIGYPERKRLATECVRSSLTIHCDCDCLPVERDRPAVVGKRDSIEWISCTIDRDGIGVENDRQIVEEDRQIVEDDRWWGCVNNIDSPRRGTCVAVSIAD